MSSDKYVLGIDYGTDSVRSVVVSTADGSEVGSAVYPYPRWKQNMYCDAAKNQFRQHPRDYLEGLENSVKDALSQCGEEIAANIVGMAIDTTGSTPVAVDKDGTPLSLKTSFEENPNAMFILWKDHTSVAEAEEINSVSKSWGGTDFTKYEGGIYSSEWFWAKILHVLRSDEHVRNAAYSWVEHCDWLPALLTGDTNPHTLKRSRCAAGHKAMWHQEFGGLPSEEFLQKIDPLLTGLRDRLYTETHTADTPVGTLAPEWAGRLGLPVTTIVSAGTFDAHAGALGGQIEAYTMSKVMGTSTCDMLVAPMEEYGDKLVQGICGQVDGSIVPGMLGLEAGQSAFGDIYAWFRNLLTWPLHTLLHESDIIDAQTKTSILDEITGKVIARLSAEAEKIPVGESGITALDWMNGRRTPDADQSLKGAIAGLTLGSDAPRIFKALVEATCFGSRLISDRFIEEGIPIKNVVALGGVAKKSPFVMQVMADVLNMPIRVASSEQTPALGAAMYAAVAAGVYADTESAKEAMGAGFDAEYLPNPDLVPRYAKLFEQYKALGEYVETSSKIKK
jgi:L-ribulokinase